MNALVERPSDRPAETVRWATCFAVVAAAHGLGAMVLLNNSFEDSDFGINAPVVMLELPESLVTSTAPAMDLPPGPVEEQESEQTPPKEETKPPEPEAEVALAPEPPQPKKSKPLPHRRRERGQCRSRAGRACSQRISNISNATPRRRARAESRVR